MKFNSLLALLALLCCPVDIYGEELLGEGESFESDKQTSFERIDGRARQGRPISQILDVKPTYSMEFRSPNKKDIKFTSERIYQASVKELLAPQAYLKCDLKMGVYAHNENSDVQFAITEGNEGGTFSVSARRVKDFVFMDLKTATVLNYEGVGNYLLTVVAQDPSTKAPFDRTQVNVSIIDVNDNPPIFARHFQHVTVDEDIPLHTSIAKVVATDADIGPNEWLYYSFTEKSSIFAIDPVSGVVTLTRSLVGKKRRSYELFVTARDRSLRPSKPSSTKFNHNITISVQPVNRFLPQIKVVSQLENVVQAKTIFRYAVIRVSDQDNGKAGEINKVQITSGNETGNFGIRRSDEALNDFIIDILKPLDRKKGTDGLKLVLTAFDKGSPPRNGTVMLHVVIKNANDMTLAFLQSKYEARISELAPPHSSVIRVLAGNGQSGKNGRIYYVLVGGDSDSFKIDHDTGLITTTSHLDYETKQLYKFDVQSFDAGSPRQMASVKVSVEIEDANDNDPVFDKSSYQFDFFEDQRPGAKLLTITATDHDFGDNGKIRYSLTNTENVPFAIDPETGDITSLTSLDRDTGLQEHITLKVRASDFGKPFRRETETFVHIQIKALNDNLPVFEYFKCDIQVAQNAPVGTLLITLSAVDTDIAASDALLYAIESAGNTDNTFQIDPASGELKTAKSLIGGVKEFSLYITVTDSVQKSKYPVTLKIKVVSSQAAVGFSNYVRVQCSYFPEYIKAVEQIKGQGNFKHSVASNDKAPPKPVNQHQPEFQVHNAVLNVSEEVSVGSSLIKLTATDKDQGFNGMVLYSIVSGNVGSSFNINMHTGELYVESPLDRETTSKYSLNISSSDCGSPRKTAFTVFTIIVVDANDNSPIFEKDSYYVELFENVTRGQTVVLVNATDLDEGENGRVSYKIVNDFGGKFRIDSTSGRISVASVLDYEDSTKYIIKVQAFDNAQLSQKMTSTMVIVNLIDINDNAPVIVPQTANVSIPEDVPLNSVVATVSAEDPDTGAGGELEFHLLDNFKKFKIDPDSGVIRLRRRVDYESQSVYNLTIKVSDKGVPPLESYANVVVNILDVNENSIAPEIDGVSGSLMYKEASVLENQPVGTSVIKLKARDKDSWFIRFAIIDGTGVDKFEIQPQTGVIRTTQVIHHADAGHYWLTVQAKDCEIYPLHTNIQLLITVMPTKVDPPYFKPAVYYPTVQENAKAGKSVVSVKAHNPNLDGSSLVYSIVRGNDTSKFAIDKDSGLVVTMVPLDREEKDQYELTVQVSIDKTPSQLATITFQVTVTDANDNAPEFIRQSKFDDYVDVKERQASSSPVELFRVVATDKDIGTNGDLTYSFISVEGRNTRNLTINPKSGVVYSDQAWTVNDFLDFEISVTDGGVPQMSDYITGSLFVTEKNLPSTNPPQFEKDIYKVSIKEDLDVGKFVTWFSANDIDHDPLLYSILSGNIGNKFQINSQRAQVMLTGKLDREEVSSYNLTVAASDDHHVAMTTLIIDIEDINDNAPQPTMTEYQVHISEDAKPGTLLTKVEAKDPDDIEQNSGVIYAIVGSVIPKSMSLFKIQSKTGKIKTIKALDYEDMREHILIIEAKDQRADPRTSLFSVVISVDDVNDHKPVFLRSEFQAEVNVNSNPGTSTIKAFAFDKDDGTNALLKFSIKGGNRNEAFYIDQNSGIIQVAKKLNPSLHKYTLQIHVSDSGSPAKTAEAQVEIFVTGIKRPAIFDRPLYQASVTENVGPGYPIINVVFNGSLASYDLVPMDSACWKDFEVNRKSGLITNKKPFDAEELSECKLTIRATSSEGDEEQTQVIVKIINENDNVPSFGKALYVGYVSEGLPVKSPVIGENGEPLVISATDSDIDSSDLIYEVVGSSAFDIDPRGGALTTAEVLDFESVSSYKFKIKVSDSGIPSLAAFVDMEVFVQDVNDIPPAFISHSFSATVFLPTFAGAEVVKVSAFDGDSPALTNLSYSIVTSHLKETFDISPTLGIITVKNVSLVKEAVYYMKVSVSDGNFTDETTVDILCIPLPLSDLKFSQESYNTSVVEGISTTREIATVRAVGYSVSEIVTYSIVTPSDVFVICQSTGVVSTLPGKEFDRETVDQYEVVVQARDGRKPLARVAQSVVLVAIEDANDNMPKFTEESYFFVVQVSVDVKSFVGRVEALDEDIGSNGAVSYFLKSGGENRFEVEHTTGDIKVRKLLDDVAIHRVFSLEIEARDNGLPQLSARTVVKVKVVDKETPIFHQLSYSKVVPEDVKVGEEISRIQARSPGGANILYSIVQGDPLNQFSIDLKTGVLTVVASLDYETLTSYQLTVRATDAKTFSFGEINVDVTVTDVNDIAPLFNRSLYLAKVSEAMPIGTSVISVYAFDGDSGVNKALTYRLDSKTSEFFTISQDNNEISVARKLDYEAHVVHELKVIATDGGSPPLTGEARVRVVVEDANDNPPRFEQDNYATSISGGVGPGFFVTRVIATDPDQSDVGKLRYSITSGHGKEFFHLDSKSGVLTISRKAGLERGKVYDLGVQVTDGKSTAKTSVRVVIGDTNDHSPVFNQETYTVDLQENYPEGMFISMVTATDEDSGKYARIRYSIDDVEASEKFSIDAETGMIYSRLTFDRENSSHAFISVPIRATDGGGRFGFCTVEVRVLDENDNQPKFELPGYEVTIQQSKPVGTPILVTSASDADTGSNSLLTYVILGHQTPPVFEIETDTGMIKMARQPEIKTYRFYILVKDGGNPQLGSMVPVSVNVVTKNAKILQFDKPEYRVGLAEDTQVRTVVTTVRPSFPGRTRPLIRFKIIPGNSPSSRGEKFSIDASGQIKLEEPLDYETLKRYVLVIEAEAPSLSQVARTVVIVSVKDINDNVPHFLANPYRVSVPENIKNGSKVLRVFAEDLDDSINGQILYEFKEESQFFAIDQYTGWITTVKNLDREVFNSLVLRVRGTDRGNLTQLSGHTAVHVTVLDVNDSPPKFSEDVFEFFVREDAIIGQEIGTVEAVDEDLYSDIYFFIMSGDPQTKFVIEQKTGKVAVQSSLDRESVSSYKLNVSASDGLYTSFVTLNITVLDANDNPPVCTQSIFIEHVQEDVKPGFELLVVEATDEDADDNGKLKYSVFGQGNGVFSAENGTGRLLTAASLDRETQDMFNFMVSAEDRGGQVCFSNITVILDDVNDNEPVFTQAEYRKSVYEDARLNTVLLQVKADDADVGKNRKLSYSLLDTAGNTFSIDSESGIISLEKSLNREAQEVYSLTVQARDMGVPSKSSTCSVVIQVLNINDVPPEFEESSYKANVSEDALKGTHITTMHAISREAGHEDMTYAILEGPDSDMFQIDKVTGSVTLQGTLDYETKKSYLLTIQASDVGPPVLSGTTSLKIIVTDANDHAPKFGQAVYLPRVDENSYVDRFVLQVFATDLDHGSNSDIRYSIVKGNEAGKFKVDPMSGVISVAAPCDYELKSKYSLTVRAQDEGKPPLSTETEVRVHINDVNDNPPEFSHTNFTVSIRENAPSGTTVISLRPHDRDGHGNAGPFNFMRLEGDESKFKLHRNGLITKVGPLDHRDGEHKFKFRVFDSGEPPQFTDKTVTIKVVETITHPPKVEPLTVYLKLYSSQFNGGVIGSVKGTDPDRDSLTYSIVEPRAASPFTITPDGVISAISNVLGRNYKLNVSVTDGKYVTYANVEIDVSDITDNILEHSLTLRLSDLGPGAFVERNLVKCRKYLGSLLRVPARKVHIWSLQSADSNLDVVFAIMKRQEGFFDSHHIAHKLNSSRGDFERTVGVKVAYIGVSQCRLMQCPENYSCQTVFKPQNKQIRIMSDRTTYISYEHSRSHACMCDRDRGCVSTSGKCSSNPCPVGYKCADVLQGFQCKCVDSSKCDLETPGCQDTSCITGDKAMTFGGDSYIRYQLKESFDEPSRSISFALKTTEPQGTLVFAAGQYDYSILEIVNGRLQLRFDFGSGAGVVDLDWARVNDGTWHHVTVKRQGNHATLILDRGRHRAWNKSPGKMRILNLDENAIYFGAKVVRSDRRRDTSNQGQRVENGFKGCLQNLNLNGEDLPMSGSTSHVTAQPFKTAPNCRLSGACRVNTCPRDSTCVETLTSKKCECLPGHSGPDCQPFVGCEASPCKNDGTCFDRPEGGYRCACQEGYTGTQCHIFIGQCVSSPCKNGGTCFPSGKDFTCSCPEGVRGLTCDQDTRPCASNPCAFNTKCTNIGNDYQCHCAAGLSGKNCEKGYHCSRQPCKNGGTCQVLNDGKNVCACVPGYTGPDCSQDVDECASSPCQNGGICVNTLGSFTCNCSTSTHGGKLCEQVLASVEARRGWPLGQTEIIGIAVFLAVLLLIVVLVVFIFRWRARRRRDHSLQSGAAKAAVLKVSPPVVGSEVTSPEPPTPPPREIHGYNVDDLGMPPGYDAEDSWRRRERTRKDFGTMKTLNSLSDNNLPGYQWDYTDIPADLVPRSPLSKERSGSYGGAECVPLAPEVPQRPSSFRSSQGSLDVPEVPKRPRNYKVSESEDGYPDPVPHVPKKPVEYINPKGKSASRYSMDSRYSEFSDATDLDPDIFKGRFPRPPRESYPESLDQHPVGSYAPTLTARGSELGSTTDGMYSEDDLEQVYLGNRMEACDDSPENSYLHSENCSEDEDDEDHGRFACVAPDPEFHKALQREIKEMMDELEELKMESEL